MSDDRERVRLRYTEADHQRPPPSTGVSVKCPNAAWHVSTKTC